MRSFQQGHLDGLCGLYSIVAVCRHLFGLNYHESAKLFRVGLTTLETRRGKLPMIMTEGTTSRDISQILKVLKAHHLIKCSKPFHKVSRVDLDVWWAEVRFFLGKGKRRAVMVGIKGSTSSHWTVINKATPKLLYLSDSAGMRVIRRRTVTTKRQTTARPLLIEASSCYFCSIPGDG